MRKLVFGLILALVAGSLFVCYNASPTYAQTNIDVYGGELPGGATYGFGFSADNLTSPGPTLNLMQGDTVTVTFHNAGSMPHNFAIVSDRNNVNSVLWNSAIQSSSNPVQPGGAASVTFTVGDAGNYYYVCQVPGHVTLGMWGNVNNVIPEFTSVLSTVLILLIVTISIIYIARIRKNSA